MAVARGPSGELSMLEGPVPGEMRRRAKALTSIYEIRDRLTRVPRVANETPDRCTRCSQVTRSPRMDEGKPYCSWCIRVVTHARASGVAPNSSESPPHEDSPDESAVSHDPTLEGR